MKNNAAAPKPYQISFENRPQYLYVYVSGEHDSYDISRQYWQEIAGECKRIKADKVLIEEDIPEGTMGEMYQLASELPVLGSLVVVDHDECILFPVMKYFQIGGGSFDCRPELFFPPGQRDQIGFVSRLNPNDVARQIRLADGRSLNISVGHLKEISPLVIACRYFCHRAVKDLVVFVHFVRHDYKTYLIADV